MIKDTRVWLEKIPLSRPYAIAFKHTESVEIAFIELRSHDGLIGLGSAAPEAMVTGESMEICIKALEQAALDTRNLVAPEALTQDYSPSAQSAIEMAHWDLWAQEQNKSLVDCWGRCVEDLPTSITIGIKPIEESLVEAEEYLKKGFTIIKLKISGNLDEDLRRTTELLTTYGPKIRLRVDANQAFTAPDFLKYVEKTENVEFYEQPFKAADQKSLTQLPLEIRKRIALDESVLNAKDLIPLLHTDTRCGILNIKLMKCGGLKSARQLAALAHENGIAIMWGCNDESCISIAAALHVAYSCKATQFLDLDGSFDLSRDIAQGGFKTSNGVLSLNNTPGLGTTKRYGLTFGEATHYKK